MTEIIKKIPWLHLGDAEQKPLTTAQRRKRDVKYRTVLRTAIQILFFLLAPSLFTSAFTGIKQIFTAIGNGQPLELNAFVRVLLVLCLFTMVFGRFFCGFACPFGSLGDLMYYLSSKVQKKMGKKLPQIPEQVETRLRYVPYVILAVIILLCGMGVYGSLSGWSPWDVFSLITAGNFRLGRYVTGVVLLVLILLGMAWESRFFCRFLCPMGAVFRLFPILPWAVLKRDTDSCLKGCSACKKNCPVGLELGKGENAGDCIRCGKCIGVCPKSNVKLGVKSLRGNELWLTGVKAVLLLAIAVVIGAARFK